jgi:hypothetical protein
MRVLYRNVKNLWKRKHSMSCSEVPSGDQQGQYELVSNVTETIVVLIRQIVREDLSAFSRRGNLRPCTTQISIVNLRYRETTRGSRLKRPSLCFSDLYSVENQLWRSN